jgi:hypothetical protein
MSAGLPCVSARSGGIVHFAQGGTAEALRIKLAALDQRNDLTGETVALPCTKMPSSLNAPYTTPQRTAH